MLTFPERRKYEKEAQVFNVGGFSVFRNKLHQEFRDKILNVTFPLACFLKLAGKIRIIVHSEVGRFLAHSLIIAEVGLYTIPRPLYNSNWRRTWS